MIFHKCAKIVLFYNVMGHCYVRKVGDSYQRVRVSKEYENLSIKFMKTVPICFLLEV